MKTASGSELFATLIVFLEDFLKDEQHAKIPSTERGNVLENFDFKTK